MQRKLVIILISFLFLLSMQHIIKAQGLGGKGNPCGNGVCQSSINEDCNSCPADCGVCPTTPPPPTSTPPPPTTGPTNPPTSGPTSQPSPGPTGIQETNPPSTDTGSGQQTTSTSQNSGGTTSAPPAPTTTPIPSIPPNITQPDIPTEPINNPVVTISGTVTKTINPILTVDVSLDDGRTWFQAEISKNRYSYITDKLEDGNYKVRVRARDTLGNTTISPTQIMIIDLLPPLIGGANFSLGPISLEANEKGVTQVPLKATVRVTFSTRGGITQGKAVLGEKIFEIKQISGTQLFYADIVPDAKGSFTLAVKAQDGAEKETERTLAKIYVAESGKISIKGTEESLKDAYISVFVYEKDSKRWTLWSGSDFGQNNPFNTLEGGEYAFMLPKGRYYVEVSKKGFKKARSEIFETETTRPVNFNFKLKPLTKISLNLPVFGLYNIYLPSFLPPDSFPINDLGWKDETKQDNLINIVQKSLPEIKLSEEKSINFEIYKGKPFLVFFVSSWSPKSQDQIAEIQSAKSQNKDLNLVVVFLQDSDSAINSSVVKGKYTFDYIVDRNGYSASDFNIISLPQTFLVGKDRIIKEAFYSTINSNQIITKLIELN